MENDLYMRAGTKGDPSQKETPEIEIRVGCDDALALFCNRLKKDVGRFASLASCMAENGYFGEVYTDVRLIQDDLDQIKRVLGVYSVTQNTPDGEAFGA